MRHIFLVLVLFVASCASTCYEEENLEPMAPIAQNEQECEACTLEAQY